MKVIIKEGVEYNLTVPDIAREIDYSEEYVRVLVRKRLIPAVKIGRDYLFNLNRVIEALEQRAVLIEPSVDEVESEESEQVSVEYEDEFEGIDLGI